MKPLRRVPQPAIRIGAKSGERVIFVTPDLRLDSRRHFSWRLAAQDAAGKSSEQGSAGRRAARCRPGRDHGGPCARSFDRFGEDFFRHADEPSEADHCEYHFAGHSAGAVWSGSSPNPRQIRSGIGAFADKIWSEKQHRTNAPFEANAATEQIYIAIQALPPKSDLQKPLQARAAQVSNDLVQTRMLLFVGSGDLIPTPFLAILVFWLVIIFGSFSLFSNLNATVIAFLSLFALSASCAIFLILELSQPFSGLMMIASGPLRNALAPLGP
jgi:hypothetical protein